MSTPVSPHPLGPAAPQEDYVGLALKTLAFALMFGLGLNALVGIVVRTLQTAEAPATGLELGAPPAVVLFGGTFLACFATATSA